MTNRTFYFSLAHLKQLARIDLPILADTVRDSRRATARADDSAAAAFNNHDLFGDTHSAFGSAIAEVEELQAALIKRLEQATDGIDRLFDQYRETESWAIDNANGLYEDLDTDRRKNYDDY